MDVVDERDVGYGAYRAELRGLTSCLTFSIASKPLFALTGGFLDGVHDEGTRAVYMISLGSDSYGSHRTRSIALLEQPFLRAFAAWKAFMKCTWEAFDSLLGVRPCVTRLTGAVKRRKWIYQVEYVFGPPNPAATA